MFTPPPPRRLATLLLVTPLILAACGGGSSSSSGSGTVSPGEVPPASKESFVVAGYDVKGYRFQWNAVPGATHYELFEDPDGPGPLPEAQIGGELTGTTYAHSLATQLLHERVNASYRLRSCDARGCSALTAALTPDLTQAIGRFEINKSSYTYDSHSRVALSADGATLVVGFPGERSADGLSDACAVYIFSRGTSDGIWQQQAHLTAAYPMQDMAFGIDLALSSDGDTLAVGAPRDSSNARGINGDESNRDAPGSGAVHVFTRNGGNWSQQAYVKARNTPQKVERCQIQFWRLPCDPVEFGTSVALSADGNLLAVGAPREGTKGIHFFSPPDVAGTGAIHTYFRSNGAWIEQAHLKGTGPDANGKSVLIGSEVTLSNDGTTLATIGDDSNLYLFTQILGSWGQPFGVWQRPPNTSARYLALSGDGKTLAYAASTSSASNGAVEKMQLQTLTRNDGAWMEETLLTVSGSNGHSIGSLALSGDGRALAVGNTDDSSNAAGINGDASHVTDDSSYSGAVNLYRRDGTTWSHSAYLKAPKPHKLARFGSSVALSSDGKTLASSDNNQPNSEGSQITNAVYLY